MCVCVCVWVGVGVCVCVCVCGCGCNKMVLDAVSQLHSTTLSTLTNMHSLFTRAWGMYTMCTLVYDGFC